MAITPLPISRSALGQLIDGRYGDPHAVLGAHPHDGGVTVRTLRPLAESVTVLHGDQRVPLRHEEHGVWVGVLDVPEPPNYRLEVTYADGTPHRVDDAYRYLPTLGEMDLHLINEGRHEQLWEVLGAHVHTYRASTGDVTGTSFAVWAPHAKGVRVKGDFNHWDGREHPMRQMGVSGVWELFVPDVGAGTRYKYAVLGADDVWREKADPLAFHAEQPPHISSMVYQPHYTWGDGGWMAARAAGDAHSRPMSAYEVHLASWRRHPDGTPLTYLELADQLVDYVRDLGYSHVELMPVMQHPFGGSWGYHTTSYFAADSRLGHPDGLRRLIDRFHQAGIGVILDWVPGHFATDEWALARFDGTPLYEDPNPQRGWHKEWGSHIFNFGRKEVRNFLVASALFWLEEFHADGLRVDGVASMLYLDYSRKPGEWAPNVYGGRENLEAVAFLQEMNATAYKRVPGVVTVAEESTAWPGVTRATHLGGLGFGFKWNMGWMHDTLGYLRNDPVHRQYHHGQMTFSILYAYAENYVLPISHDEVVHGKGSLLRKMPGDRWRQLANLRCLLAYMWAHPGKQLLFMGSEMAQESEWAESRELDWWLLDNADHRGVHSLVRDLNRVYRETPALWALDSEGSGFHWIDANDSSNNMFSFLRMDSSAVSGQAAGSVLACVANFSALPHEGYRIGLPSAGTWVEVLNTDADVYAGSGVGNLGAVEAVPEPWHGQPASATLRVPPLGALWLVHKDAGAR
jgi:1,4-alpha-glucan branching enzyme